MEKVKSTLNTNNEQEPIIQEIIDPTQIKTQNLIEHNDELITTEKVIDHPDYGSFPDYTIKGKVIGTDENGVKTIEISKTYNT